MEMKKYGKLPIEERDFFTVPEVQAMLDVARPTVDGWLDEGVLPYYRLGPRTIRIRRPDLDCFLETHRYPAPAPVPTAPPARARRPGHEKYMPLPPEGGDMDAGKAGEANGDEAAA